MAKWIMIIRAARPEDIPVLSAIACEAKAFWGYTPAQLAAWRPELEVTPESLTQRHTFVLEWESTLAAFAQVNPATRPWEFASLWVRPEYMRRGLGRALVSHVTAFAAARGQHALAIDADPHAEPFYLRCGAKIAGYLPAPISGAPERKRPQLLLTFGNCEG